MAGATSSNSFLLSHILTSPASSEVRKVMVIQSCLTFCDPMDPLFMGPPRQEYWRGLPFPSPGDLPNPEVKSRSPALQADSLLSEPPGKPWWTQMVKLLSAIQESRVRSLGWEEPLKKGMATLSSILAWRIPWAEEPDWLQSLESQRFVQD